jgi:vesicle coat complex subunit
MIAKYENLENYILSHLDNHISKQITLARYFPERSQWIIIDPLATNNKKSKTTTTTTTTLNLKLEPYKLNDLTVIGVLEGKHLTSDDFDSQYDKLKRQEIDYEKEQKRINRERNRTDNDRNQQNGSSGRRKSPQNTMRINVDDFDS